MPDSATMEAGLGSNDSVHVQPDISLRSGSSSPISADLQTKRETTGYVGLPDAKIAPGVADMNDICPVIRPKLGFSIRSTNDRPVTKTVNIEGGLPNRIFTLVYPALSAILVGAESDVVPFLCRKFFIVWNSFNKDQTTFADRGTTTILKDGRIYAEGNNLQSSCALPASASVWIPRLRHIRLPPVLQVWAGHGGWFAKTTRGMYSWGNCEDNRLGHAIDDYSPSTQNRLGRVDLAEDVIDVLTYPECTFFRTKDGWWACGCCTDGQLATGQGEMASHPPLRIPDSADIQHIYSNEASTFALTTRGDLLAAGRNRNGQLGISSESDSEDHFIAVDLASILANSSLSSDLGDVSTRVEVNRVYCSSSSTFILLASQVCLVCGMDSNHNLGLGTHGGGVSIVRTPRPLPFLVRDVITAHGTTIFIDGGGTVLACGHNDRSQIGPRYHNAGSDIRTPIPLDLPWPVERLVIGDEMLFAKTPQGKWYARGNNDSGRLGLSARRRLVPWERVCLSGILSIHSSLAATVVHFVTGHGVFVSGSAFGFREARADTLGADSIWPRICRPMRVRLECPVAHALSEMEVNGPAAPQMNIVGRWVLSRGGQRSIRVTRQVLKVFSRFTG